MNNIIKYIVSVILSTYGGIIKYLSWSKAARIGSSVGLLMASLSSKRYQLTAENIRKAIPEADEQEIDEITKASYRNLGITMSELLKCSYCTADELMDRVIYSNPGLLSAVHSEGKGLILLSGHFGNWEFLAITAGIVQPEKVNVIVKYQNNDRVNRKLIKLREKWGNNIIDMGKAARPILKIVKNGGIIALLADQRATKDKDVYVPFFGRNAATYEAPASLSYKYDIPIVMGFANRQPDGRYQVDLVEVDRANLDSYENPIHELTKRHVSLLEKEIRKSPGSWAWQHDRWKFKSSN